MNIAYKIPVVYTLTQEQYEGLLANAKLASKVIGMLVTPEEEFQNMMTFGSSYHIDSKIGYFDRIYRKEEGKSNAVAD